MTTSLVYKAWELSKVPKLTKHIIFDSFFKDMRNRENALHMIVRALNFFLLTYFTIKIADYSTKAGINFGIIMSLLTLSVIYQAIVFWLFFGEKLNWKMIIGIVVVISGIVLISFGRG